MNATFVIPGGVYVQDNFAFHFPGRYKIPGKGHRGEEEIGKEKG